jgi:hypothetical protein
VQKERLAEANAQIGLLKDEIKTEKGRVANLHVYTMEGGCWRQPGPSPAAAPACSASQPRAAC